MSQVWHPGSNVELTLVNALTGVDPIRAEGAAGARGQMLRRHACRWMLGVTVIEESILLIGGE